MQLSHATSTINPVVSENFHYPQYLWFCVLSLLAALSMLHVFVLVTNWIAQLRLLRQRMKNPYAEPVVHHNVNRWRVCLALLNTYHLSSYRIELRFGLSASYVILLVGYLFLVLLLTFIKTDGSSIAIWGNRSAVIAASQIPLLPLLSAKNNIISLLTGASSEKLSVIHRFVARTVFALVWLHSGARITIGLTGSDSSSILWVQLGVIATAALTLCVFISLRPVRQSAFEFFGIAHNILILIFLISSIVHVQKSRKMGYWIWPGLLLWGLDRALRVFRLCVFNRPWSRSGGTTATLELVSQDCVRVTFTRPMSWRAGQYAYLTFPGISLLPFESHPFSIASVPSAGAKQAFLQCAGNELEFIIKARKGVTALLRNHVALVGTASVTALVDGPYGEPPNLLGSSACIFIAGGSGVSYTFPLLMDLVRKSQAGKSMAERIVFVWIIHSKAHMAWIFAKLHSVLAAAPPHIHISTRIFVTSRIRARAKTPPLLFVIPAAGKPSSPSSHRKTQRSILVDFAGRPDIRTLLGEEVAVQGAVSVVVSGPHQLVKSVRDTLNDIAGPRQIFKGQNAVSLHVDQRP